jgi:hypothetical protein
MKEANTIDSLLPAERRTLNNLGVNLKATSLTFQRKLTQKQMRDTWSILMNLRVRAMRAKDDSINWALGDWALMAEHWFGEKFVQDSINEENKLRSFRNHVLMLRRRNTDSNPTSRICRERMLRVSVSQREWKEGQGESR